MKNQRYYRDLSGISTVITGGMGFIGSNLAHRLVELGAGVTCLDAQLDPYGWNPYNLEDIRERISFEKVDVRDMDSLRPHLKDADIVFHLAAQVSRRISMENPFLDTDINCRGTLNVLDCLRQDNPGAALVYAGSRGQTGQPVKLPVDEDHPDRPTDNYGVTKLAAEQYCMVYARSFGIKAVSLRLNNVYGPRCQIRYDHYGVLNLFIRLALQDSTLNIYGEGLQTRDYVYVDDVCDAMIAVAVHPETGGKRFVAGSGVETRFADMARHIVDIVGSGTLSHVPFPELIRKIDITRFVADPSRIRNLTGISLSTGLKEGITKTVTWYRRHLEHYL